MGLRLVLITLTLAAQLQPRSPGSEVEAFVRQAIEERFGARAIPDHNLLGAATRVAVRQEMPLAGESLTSAALPRLDGYEFYLTTAAAAQAEADRTRRNVTFLIVDRPVIAGDTATLWLGVDIAIPADPNNVKLCCCTGLGQFRRAQGRWAFVEWTERVCS